jgi:hypothetical protein
MDMDWQTDVIDQRASLQDCFVLQGCVFLSGAVATAKQARAK